MRFQDSAGLHEIENSVGIERNEGSRHCYSDQKVRFEEVAGLTDINNSVGIERNKISQDRYPRLRPEDALPGFRWPPRHREFRRD